MLREMVLFLRRMFCGERVPFGEFPALSEFFRLDLNAQGFLRIPPEKPVEIFVAAAGPETLKIAARWERALKLDARSTGVRQTGLVTDVPTLADVSATMAAKVTNGFSWVR